MKKILIFMLILIFSISCNNASKTGSSYNNSSNNNTGQESNEEGNNSSTEQGGNTTVEDDNTDNTIKTDNDWKNKLANRRIQNANIKYEFDKDSNIYVNQETEIRWTFVKYLGNNKGLYSEKADPSDIVSFNNPSGTTTTIYSILTIEEPNDNVYLLKGTKYENWKREYLLKVGEFEATYGNEEDLADWSKYPHMTENDLDTTKKGDNLGYLNPVK
ncbi:hypothetical protein [Brachyspira sp. G79]|uniref:hypothetical protein n=1 Tax=Brachyspira sp. G79 TaxID=1358104 RepID=UPI000BBBD87A|nr:hypothetical protein [Brachyspira sp. G79]PCG19129.1 hypothetical protein KQ44_03005 [Brachyspira sp. G79]